MNKNEFVNELRKNLQGLPLEDIQDILSDYEEHFDVGMSKGKSESEIAKELGEPKEIAEGYRSNYQTNFQSIYQANPVSIETGYRVADIKANTDDSTRKFLIGLLLVIANLVVLFGPFMAVLGVLIGFYGAGIGIFIGGIWLILGFPLNLSMFVSTHHLLTTLGLGVGLGALGALILIFSVYITKLLYKLVVKYVKWNIKLINE